MPCRKCRNLLNLDASFPPDSLVDGGPRLAHHNSYWALWQAAHAGCELCQLILESSHGGSQATPLPNLAPSPAEQISVRLFHDNLSINIPKIIEDDDFTDDDITLYICTGHG